MDGIEHIPSSSFGEVKKSKGQFNWAGEWFIVHFFMIIPKDMSDFTI